jgi:hypothetical protein
MSDLLFPLDLPGVDIKIERTPIYSTAVLEAQSGKEQRASWWSAPRYKYVVQVNFMRSNGPDGDEGYRLIDFLDQHAGRFDSFLLDDPYDGVQRRVRFDDDALLTARVLDGVWEALKIALISVK